MSKTLQQNFRTLLKYGILGSVVALYLAAIGMVETFAQRNLVGSFLSLGHVFLVMGAVGAGILTTRALKKENASDLESALGLTVMTAIFLPSVRSVTRISRTVAGLRAFFMNVTGSSLYSMISCFLPVIRSRVWMFLPPLPIATPTWPWLTIKIARLQECNRVV